MQHLDLRHQLGLAKKDVQRSSGVREPHDVVNRTPPRDVPTRRR
ncbi:hypothetical protein [Streptomyces cinerochromogenes]